MIAASTRSVVLFCLTYGRIFLSDGVNTTPGVLASQINDVSNFLIVQYFISFAVDFFWKIDNWKSDQIERLLSDNVKPETTHHLDEY